PAPGANGDRAKVQDLRWLGSSAHGCGGSHQLATWFRIFKILQTRTNDVKSGIDLGFFKLSAFTK
ncbi:hypothetical protein LINPERHAP2_LOCUS195, partial [Linum perenne]